MRLTTMRTNWMLSLLGLAACLIAAPAGAQNNRRPLDPTKDVGLDQKLDAQVPLDIPFKDETGKDVRIGDYLSQKKPVIVNLIFYKCAGVCTLELDGISHMMPKMHLKPGVDYDVVTVSINPKETPSLAADKKVAYLGAMKLPEAENGWHFLTGTDENIHRLAAAIGYRYVANLEKEQFAHPAGFTVLTPEGKISKYIFGSEYSPRDVRLALIEASENKIGTPIDQILLRCLHFDTMTGKYSFAVVKIIQLGGLLTLLTLGSFWVYMSRWDKRRLQEEEARNHPDAAMNTGEQTS